MTCQPHTPRTVRRGIVALTLFVLALLFAFAGPSPRASAQPDSAAPESSASEDHEGEEVVRIPSEAFEEDLAETGDEAAEAKEPAEAEAEDKELPYIPRKIDEGAGWLVGKIAPVLLYGIPTGLHHGEDDPATEPDESIQTFPLILMVLVLGGITFTLLFGFVNLRLFKHAFAVIRGKFDDPNDEGEINHFQALTSALSATVGLGNIASVAVAIATGGAGAVFWMWVIAFFGMSLKFSSCTFGQLFRRVNPDGTVLGGPMVYLDEGIRQRYPKVAWLGKVFGISFAVLTMFAAFGGGNMFQGNQSFAIASEQFGWDKQFSWVFGLVLSVLVGIVIIGGIRRIGEVTSKLVPAMCVFYCLTCLAILAVNYQNIPHMFAEIFQSAFTWKAGLGGILGTLITGATRAAFSNEAGLGSAAIAHAAARTKEPVREGVVAMIGPFIDTIIVCTMTALTILVTDAHVDFQGEEKGIVITNAAFGTLHEYAPYVLCVAVFIFAYSTIISWSYYGEKSTEYLFGRRGVLPYRIVYVLMVILGPILTLENVLNFSDMLILSMAFPNIIGMLILYPVIRPKVKDYISRLRSGEMKPYK